MSELRYEPLHDRWVIVAKSRGERPQQVATPVAPLPPSGRCPFCAGHEVDTPPATGAWPSDDDWQVRVVPNKFPALDADSPDIESPGIKSPGSKSTNIATADSTGDSLDRCEPGYGWHEVVIESRAHFEQFTEAPLEVVRLAFRAYQARLRALAADPRIAYVQIFKNNGASAGASLPHIHSQVLALPRVPPVVERMLREFARHQRESRQCLLCERLERELAQGERIVLETPRFVAFCPYASRFPYEVCLAPRRHAARYEDCSASELDELADAALAVLRRFRALGADVAYNFLLHTTPTRSPLDAPFHWHWELFPRLNPVAGFEWGTEYFINPVPPEEAAARLREAIEQ